MYELVINTWKHQKKHTPPPFPIHHPMVKPVLYPKFILNIKVTHKMIVVINKFSL